MPTIMRIGGGLNNIIKLAISMEQYAYNGKYSDIYDSGNTNPKTIGYYLRTYLPNGGGNTCIQASNDKSSWTNIANNNSNTITKGVLETSYRYFRIYGVSWYSGCINSGALFVIE